MFDGPIDAVLEFNNSNKLIDVYQTEYEKKYGVKPQFSMRDNPSFVAQELVRMFGFDKAVLIVAQYFKVTDRWIVEKRHPLDSILREANAINTAIPKKREETTEQGGFKVLSKFGCEKCSSYFDLTCSPKELDSTYREKLGIWFLCPKCKGSPLGLESESKQVPCQENP